MDEDLPDLNILLGITREVNDCPRCGDFHEVLLFHPMPGDDEDFAYWATCPTTQAPVLLSVEQH